MPRCPAKAVAAVVQRQALLRRRSRVELLRAAELAVCFLILSQLLESDAEVVVRAGRLWIALDGCRKFFRGFIRLPALEQSQAEIEVRTREVRA